MKRFSFKLKNVLKYRETLESLAKNAYREALGQVNLEKQRLAVLEQQRNSVKSVYNIKAGTSINPDDLTLAAKFRVQILALIQNQKDIILEKEKIAKEKLNAWNEKRKEVEVIKKLEEKKWKEYLKEMDKEEQSFQDEVFIAKTVREMNK